MLYLFNKTIKSSIHIVRALTDLYGIHRYQSQKICASIGVNPKSKLSQIKKNHINLLIKYINKNMKIEQPLKQKQKNQRNTLLNIKLTRALRFNQGLPVRGQRTHTNAKTVQKCLSKPKNKLQR